ncbi:hypothetical protein [Herbidospora sp. RD11066]
MYAITFDPVAEQQRDALPTPAVASYMEACAVLEVAPWSGEPPANNPVGNMLTKTFGTSGLLTYLVLEERRLVYVIRIHWLG